ncbi:hypothetical protein EA473_01120 [Natrarchaeobius chitinivorans]|uniref:Uncharacterized protein n=2 Tax=Natrarchaeobius chitinivorans TaxID=1679083 RepID=A0A3N6MAZ2_NATCH|nr:hypothetical protein EA473_01120 [Natrarchaeobius chitinivorans]
MDRMMKELVEEYLERDLVTPEGKLLAQFLLVKDDPAEALDVVLENRKSSTNSCKLSGAAD